jgi:acyl-CoA reductase-like NAD-dependent aldehyde dehydrogenase
MNSAGPLSARQVRDQIRKKFPGLVERHKDPLASVTTVLSRLAQYSEARCSIVGPGRRVWQWSAESASSRTLVEERTSSVEAPMQ